MRASLAIALLTLLSSNVKRCSTCRAKTSVHAAPAGTFKLSLRPYWLVQWHHKSSCAWVWKCNFPVSAMCEAFLSIFKLFFEGLFTPYFYNSAQKPLHFNPRIILVDISMFGNLAMSIWLRSLFILTLKSAALPVLRCGHLQLLLAQMLQTWDLWTHSHIGLQRRAWSVKPWEASAEPLALHWSSRNIL